LSLHRRRRTTPVTSARRRTIFVSSLMSTIMCTRSAIPAKSPSCTTQFARLCGSRAPLTNPQRSRVVDLRTRREPTAGHRRCGQVVSVDRAHRCCDRAWDSRPTCARSPPEHARSPANNSTLHPSALANVSTISGIQDMFHMIGIRCSQSRNGRR
jgi:hypothetical protein